MSAALIRPLVLGVLLSSFATLSVGCPDVDLSNEGMNHHDKRTGQKHGLWTTYHSNGVKESEGRYDQGRQVGTWTFYDQTGKLLRTEVWTAGTLSQSFDGAPPPAPPSPAPAVPAVGDTAPGAEGAPAAPAAGSGP